MKPVRADKGEAGGAKYINFLKHLSDSLIWLHCTENLIYLFPEKELCGFSPNSYIHVTVSDGSHIWLQQNRQTDPGNT